MSGLQDFRFFGWKGSLILMVATVGYIVIGAELSIALNWPDHYGFQCHGRYCLGVELRHSPALLHGGHGGTLLEYLLFAWLWLFPIGMLAAFVWACWDARRRSRGLIYPKSKS